MLLLLPALPLSRLSNRIRELRIAIFRRSADQFDELRGNIAWELVAGKTFTKGNEIDNPRETAPIFRQRASGIYET